MQLDQTRMDLEENSIELQRKNEDLAVAEEELRQYNEELLTINENIEYQKQTITTAHKNITDSINYAKTIQNALLPKPHIIETWFKEYFVIFQPREHVSGDFYYVNKIEKYLFVAVADCTGHGVPGGFMTMLSVTQLHEIIRRFETTNTGEILNILRTRIKEIFQSFGTDNQNGLDIAFCVIDTEQNTMQYSGAFNPLVIIRNHEIIEYKATRNPIGFYPKEKAFEVHNIQLQNNDLIYLFSDGYQDQVGGNAHRKFSKQKLMELIIENNNLPLNIQKETFENNFKTWKKDEKQTDDVTFMGIKWIVK